MASIMKIDGITKTYPGVKALDNVSFDIQSGEVHALMGENGAGKSTLIKVISGAVSPDSGTIWIDGKPYKRMSPALSKQLSVSVIYQEYNLVPSLSVLENVFLGDRIGGAIVPDFKQMRKMALDAFTQIGVSINPEAMVSTLSVAQQQIVEIARSLCQNVKVLIMDEPSAALAVGEVKRLFEIIRTLKSRGVTIVYISHRMDEVFELADSITVLRDGRHVETRSMQGLSRKDVIRLMVGRELNECYPRSNIAVGEPVLELEHVSGNGDSDISFTLRKGEVLGLAGLVGSGRTELAKLICGAAKITSGVIRVKGRAIHLKSPGHAVDHGIGLISENRKTEGVFLDYSIRWNIGIMSLRKFSRMGMLDKKALDERALEMSRRFRIKTPTLEQLVRNLSGGNQQKTAIAKVLSADTDIILFDEPTRGIDVGVKNDIYCLINELSERGISIIMISSEMEELIGMSDRILVLHEGKIAGELARVNFSQQRILELASGM